MEIGMKVDSPRFGTGIILNVEEQTVTVDFNGVQKKLFTAFSNLTPFDGIEKVATPIVIPHVKSKGEKKRAADKKAIANPKKLNRQDSATVEFMRAHNKPSFMQN